MAQHARPQQAEHHLEPSRTGLGKVNRHWTLDEDELARRVRVYLRTFAPGQYCRTKELEQVIEFKDLGSTPWASAALCRIALKKLADLPTVVSPRLARARLTAARQSGAGAGITPRGCAVRSAELPVAFV